MTKLSCSRVTGTELPQLVTWSPEAFQAPFRESSGLAAGLWQAQSDIDSAYSASIRRMPRFDLTPTRVALGASGLGLTLTANTRSSLSITLHKASLDQPV